MRQFTGCVINKIINRMLQYSVFATFGVIVLQSIHNMYILVFTYVYFAWVRRQDTPNGYIKVELSCRQQIV